MLISSENNQRNINLNFLLRFECAGAGHIKAILKIPEFRRRMTAAVFEHGSIDEKIFVDVLKGLHDDAKAGMFKQGDLPLGTIRNTINRLERSMQNKQSEEALEPKEVLL